MDAQQRKALADELARNRKAGLVSDLPLAGIRDLEEATAIQSAALAAFAADVVGYTIVGTTAAVRRSMGLDQPIFGAIAQGSVVRRERARFRLPAGFIGAQCELVFTIGLVPGAARTIDRALLDGCILGCQPAIGLLGRRTVAPPPPLGAVADFSLHVATICGRYCDDLAACDLGAIVVRASIDGHEIAHAPAGTVMGDPLAAVAWLAAEPRRDGVSLDPGDIVATGSCTPILQVLPGQHLEVDFGPIGRVACDFE